MNILALDPGHLTGLMYICWEGSDQSVRVLERGFFREKELRFVLGKLFRENPPDRILVERTQAHPVEGRTIRWLEQRKWLPYTVQPHLVHALLFGRLLGNRDEEGQRIRTQIAEQYGIKGVLSMHELDALLLVHFYLHEAEKRGADPEDPMWFYDVIRKQLTI
ncbi:hypothetical protein skT53_08220 [Effusibacillus dendaii]|uniref:Uncharacterized protein n=2 Tax=Effusibacillus dendaii TaxID=2743772 RepID=A0A7I8D775_9BACL|nr:hypothetical protein skT53_08220 [Effusibacillus dendaii]